MASRRLSRVALSAALVTGALLRLWNLRAPAAGEELAHLDAVRAGHQQGGDAALAIIDRLWIEAGLPVSDLALRLPALICGLALLLWLPRVVSRRLGDGPGLATAWLLALSPPFVHASRAALPWSPVALLGAFSAVSFLRWWICGHRPAAALYALCAALAAAFHAPVAPFVLAPWIFAAGDLCVRPRTSARPKPSQILIMGLVTGVALAPVLVPAGRAVDPAGSASLAVMHALLMLGSEPGWPLLALPVWAAALVGLALLWRRERRLAAFSLTLVLTPVAVAVTRPAFIERDLFVVLPVVLVWAAVALAEPWRR
jgi:hypothetical protein